MCGHLRDSSFTMLFKPSTACVSAKKYFDIICRMLQSKLPRLPVEDGFLNVPVRDMLVSSDLHKRTIDLVPGSSALSCRTSAATPSRDDNIQQSTVQNHAIGKLMSGVKQHDSRMTTMSHVAHDSHDTHDAHMPNMGAAQLQHRLITQKSQNKKRIMVHVLGVSHIVSVDVPSAATTA